jgi:hypothetical protein
VAFAARAVVVAALLLLAGCGTPSMIVVAPFLVVYLAVMALVELVVAVARKAYALSWHDLYRLGRSGVTAAVGRTGQAFTLLAGRLRALSRRDAYRIAVRGAAATGALIAAVVFGLVLYVVAVVAFVVVELPFWIFLLVVGAHGRRAATRTRARSAAVAVGGVLDLALPTRAEAHLRAGVEVDGAWARLEHDLDRLVLAAGAPAGPRPRAAGRSGEGRR